MSTQLNATCTSLHGSLTCLARGDIAGLTVSHGLVSFVGPSLGLICLVQSHGISFIIRIRSICVLLHPGGASFLTFWRLIHCVRDADRRLIGTPQLSFAFSTLPWTYSLYAFLWALFPVACLMIYMKNILFFIITPSSHCFSLIWYKPLVDYWVWNGFWMGQFR